MESNERHRFVFKLQNPVDWKYKESFESHDKCNICFRIQTQVKSKFPVAYVHVWSLCNNIYFRSFCEFSTRVVRELLILLVKLSQANDLSFLCIFPWVWCTSLSDTPDLPTYKEETIVLVLIPFTDSGSDCVVTVEMMFL